MAYLRNVEKTRIHFFYIACFYMANESCHTYSENEYRNVRHMKEMYSFVYGESEIRLYKSLFLNDMQ